MTNLERFYRSVHGRDLQPWERQLAVRIAAALNTTTDDDFVVHLLLVYMSTNAITNMYNELVAARNSLAEDSRDLIQALTADLRRNRLMTYVLLGVAALGILVSAGILGTVLSPSQGSAANEARLAAAHWKPASRAARPARRAGSGSVADRRRPQGWRRHRLVPRGWIRPVAPATGLPDHSSRTETLSLAPVASRTEIRAKPAPPGSHSARRRGDCMTG